MGVKLKVLLAYVQPERGEAIIQVIEICSKELIYLSLFMVYNGKEIVDRHLGNTQAKGN